MKKNKIIISLVVGIVVVVVGINIINNNKVNGEGIKIGVISILSGEYAVVGEAFVNGVTLAQEDYIASGGSLSINLIFEDDAYEAKKGLSAYKKLTSIDKIDALINTSSITIGSIYDQIVESGMPTIQAFEQPTTPVKDNVFQSTPYSIITTQALAEDLNDTYGPDEIAVVYANEPAYIKFAESFMESFGGEIGNKQIVDPDLNDLRTPTLKILEKKPKVIIFYIADTHSALIIRETEKISPETEYVFGLIPANLDNYKEVLGDTNVLNGTTLPVMYNSTNEEFAKKYTERFGIEPSLGADYGYDSFNILIRTYDNDDEKWVNNIQKTNIEGVSGNIQFDEIGTRAPLYRFGTIKNGELPQ